MISTATIFACIVTLFISLVLPIAALIVYGLRHKGKGIYTAWFLGGTGFFVTQMILRTPILNLLATTQGFTRFATEDYILYCIFLGFTAGLFELGGRYMSARLLGKELTYERSVSAGLGHGGIEAMLIVGVTYINNLIYILMIRSGAFETLIAQTAAMGVDVSQLYAIQDALVNTSSGMFLLGGYERILTMICHVAMTMIVCYSVNLKRPIPGLLICLVFHTILDSATGIIMGLSTETLGSVITQNTAYVITYVFLTAVAVASLVFLRYVRKHWQSAEAQETAYDAQ